MAARRPAAIKNNKMPHNFIPSICFPSRYEFQKLYLVLGLLY